MGETRFKNGLAYGRFANFYVGDTAGLFAQGDTTPDVTDGHLFYSNNTTNTIITHFDLTAPGPIPGGSAHVTISQLFEGKAIKVIFLDDSTGLANAGRLILSSSDNLTGANNTAEFIYHNSSWIEISRSYNNSQVVRVTSSSVAGAVNLATAAAGTGAVNVRGNVNVIECISEAGTNTILRRAINGQQGQMLTIVGYPAGSDTLVICNSAAADTFVVTSSQSTATQFRLASSGAITFVRSGNVWLEVRPVSGNSSGQLQ